jgi:hypothetical protein
MHRGEARTRAPKDRRGSIDLVQLTATASKLIPILQKMTKIQNSIRSDSTCPHLDLFAAHEPLETDSAKGANGMLTSS